MSAFCIGSDQRMYFAYLEKYMGFAQAGLFLKTWNGQFLSSYPGLLPETFYTTDNNRISVCMHKNEMYMGGSFLNRDSSIMGIVKWDGSKWTKVAGGIYSDYPIHQEISVNDLLSFKDRLYACGKFNKVGNISAGNFAVLDNGQWSAIDCGSGSINDLHASNDTLFAAGSFKSMDGKTVNNIAALVAGQWSDIGFTFNDEILSLGYYKGSLIAVGKSNVWSYSNGAWTDISISWGLSCIKVNSVIEHEGILYLSGTFQNNSGIKSHLISWNGNIWQSLIKNSDVSPKNQSNYFIALRDKDLLFGGKINTLFGEVVNNIVELYPGKTIVSGKLFIDRNGDCMYNLGDESIKDAIVSIDNGKYYTSTDIYGNYSAAVSAGVKHNVKVFANDEIQPSCGKASIDFFGALKDSSIILDFPFEDKPLPPLNEIKLSCETGFVVKHGYVARYQISFNSPEPKFPIRLVLKYNPGLSNFYSETAAVSIKNDEIEWLIDDNQKIEFSFRIDPVHFQMNDLLNFKLNAFNGTTSLAETELNQRVVSAYDPNDKQCDKTEITTTEQSLNYRIRFQNLGNAEATDVFVVDTISEDLPMQFIKMTDYSHKGSYSIGFKVRDHAIIWSFKDINLGPKSMVGDALSSGYLEFHSGLQSGLKIGDSISNKAEIYFDFQAAVVTNTALTQVTSRGTPINQNGISLELFPNPNNGTFEIRLFPSIIEKIEVYDVCGRLVHSMNGNGGSENSIEMSGLSAGIYTIKVRHALGVVSRNFVVN